MPPMVLLYRIFDTLTLDIMVLCQFRRLRGKRHFMDCLQLVGVTDGPSGKTGWRRGRELMKRYRFSKPDEYLVLIAHSLVLILAFSPGYPPLPRLHIPLRRSYRSQFS